MKSPAPWPGIAGLFLLALLAYLPVLTQGGWIWDDDEYVTANPTLTSGAGLRDIWLDPRATPQYYPLVHTSFWVEYRLFGLDPRGYHWTNVLLHAASAVVFWRWLAALGLPGAWLAAALFVVHPVHVESVAWVTERKNVLSCLFALLSARLLWMSGPLAMAGAVLCFVAALLGKTVVASLPAAALVVFWWQRRPVGRLRFAVLGGMLVLGVSLGLRTAHLEVTQVGAQGTDFAHGMLARCLLAGRIVWFYLGKLLAPYPLMFVYPRWTPVTSGLVWLFPLAAVAVVGLLWWRRRQLGRGPLAVVLLYGGLLVPVLGFFNVYPMRFSFVADHFAYHASLPLLAGAAALLVRILSATGPRRVAAGGLLLVLLLLTMRQGRNYAGEEELWTHTLAHNPQAFLAHHNLGAVRRRQALAARERGESGEELLAAAERHYAAALALQPSAKLHFAAGELQVQRAQLAALDPDRLRRAGQHFRQALELEPDFAWAHLSLGQLYSAGPLQDVDQAIVHLERVGSLSTTRRVDQIRLEAARESCRQPLSAALVQRGRRRLLGGEFTAALDDWRRAARLFPESWEPDYWTAWLRTCHADAALRRPRRGLELAQAVVARHSSAATLDLLAAAWAANGDYSQAREISRQVREEVRKSGSPPPQLAVEDRQALYLQGKPFRSPHGAPRELLPSP